MDSTRSHIPQQPKWFIAFRILQLIFTVIVLGLSAYGVASTFNILWTAHVLALFTCSVGVPVLIWELVSMTASPKAYNYWAVLAFEIFFVIFWLSTFASLAALTSAIASATTYYDLSKRDYYYYSDIYVTYGYYIILAVNTAIAAINFAWYIVTIVLTSIYIHRHRKAGGVNRPSSTPYDVSAPAYTSGVPGPEKYDSQTTTIPLNNTAPQSYAPPTQAASSYAPSPIQPTAASDQYPTFVGHQNA
ncbi:MAG: hypothetical protein M1820_009617 [Bogoriella megaspora]|nr:MAG: hypothetical protein M1820_009617 [Bogoriella megaspora]